MGIWKAAITLVVLAWAQGCSGADNISQGHPGMLCRASGAGLSPPVDVAFVAGRAMNRSESSGVIDCPLVIHAATEITSVAVTVLDRHPTEEVLCRAVKVNNQGAGGGAGTSSGSGFPRHAERFEIVSSSGDPNRPQRLILGLEVSDFDVDDYFYVNCAVPGVFGGNRSGIISYQLDMLR